MTDVGPRLLWLPLAVLGGWVVGLVSAAASERLTRADELPLPTPRGALLRDPLVQGGTAACWAALLLAVGPGTRWAALAALAVPLVQVAVTDLRYRYVYTVVAAAGLVLGLLLSAFVHDAPWWAGIAGAVGGASLFGVLYGLGRLLYRGSEPLARGDVTIAAMVGAIAGPHALVALLGGALLSGAVSLGVAVVRRSTRVFIPYGPGLCAGGLLALFLG